MESKLKLKDLRLKAAELAMNRITTAKGLKEALPILIALKERIEKARSNLNGAAKAYEALNELCCAYVRQRQGVLDDKHLKEEPNGVMTGNVTTDDGTFHVALGFKGYRRIGGGNATADFLAGLPDSWVKTIKALDVTGINEDDPDKETLAKYGLEERPNFVWSVKADEAAEAE